MRVTVTVASGNYDLASSPPTSPGLLHSRFGWVAAVAKKPSNADIEPPTPSAVRTKGSSDFAAIRRVLQKYFTSVNSLKHGEKMGKSTVHQERIQEHAKLIVDLYTTCGWRLNQSAVKAAPPQ
eukprot:6880507-Pyramimonas_sp.AAC.1